MLAPEVIERFTITLFAGVGMLSAAGLNVLMPRAGVGRRALVSLLVGAGVVAGAWAWTDSLRVAGLVSGAMALAVCACLLLGSSPMRRVATATVGRVCRPVVCSGVLGAIGLAAAVSSAMVYTAAEDESVSRNMADVELVGSRPPAVNAPVKAMTDRGGSVALQVPLVIRDADTVDSVEERSTGFATLRDHVIRRQRGNDQSNCHGWVFTGGRYWVNGSSVDSILQENGYESVTTPRPGDLAVYRENGLISHTALVRYVTEGMPVLVEGKWGCGGVYLHPLDKCPYGAEVTFYRSPRLGHLLTINDSADPRVEQPATE